MAMSEVILFNKPYRVLSQFTDREQGSEPGQLSRISFTRQVFGQQAVWIMIPEGLLVLTADGALQPRKSLTHGGQRSLLGAS